LKNKEEDDNIKKNNDPLNLINIVISVNLENKIINKIKILNILYGLKKIRKRIINDKNSENEKDSLKIFKIYKKNLFLNSFLYFI